MLTLSLAVVLVVAPQLRPWTARVPDTEGATVTVYPARELAADRAPCLADPKLTLIDERCTDEKSLLALIASVSKEAPLTALATAKTDADGRFKVQLPPGRFFVRVATERYLIDYVVEPVDGVETVLDGNELASRRELVNEIGALIGDRAEPEELTHDIWVIGQDNPQVVRLDPAQLTALIDGEFKGPAFLWGCSRVVTAAGRALGTTCEPEKRRQRGLGYSTEVELKGTVSFGGKPRAGVEVRQEGSDANGVTDARGRFSFPSEVKLEALLIAEDGDLRAAELVTPERGAPQALALRLSKSPLPTLRVRDEAGQPVPNANVRFWYRGRAHAATTDPRGECIAPTSLSTSVVSVWSQGKAPFSGWLDLTRAEPVVLRAAPTLEVSFRSPDGVLMHQPDVRCERCDVLDDRPSRYGRVVLALTRGPAVVQVKGTELVLSKSGPVVVPPRSTRRTAAPPKGITVQVDEDLEVGWSTANNQPAPGRQFVRLCDRIGCETRVVDVPTAGTVTLAPLTPHRLEVRATGFKAGAKMPTSVLVSGPNLKSSEYGSFDRDGVATFERLPPGPWQVTVDLRPQHTWCDEGRPCTLDLASSEQKAGLTLRGSVPKSVVLVDPESYMPPEPTPVRNGVVELHSRSPVIVERTTLSVDDGGVRVVQLAPPVDVQVKVVDAKNQPVPDAIVSLGQPRYGWLGDETALTDPSGVVVFPRTRPGNLPVRVAKAGYAVGTTSSTQAKNMVVLQPAASLTCTLREVREPAEVVCSATFDGGRLEGEHLTGGSVTLRDLPRKEVTAYLEVVEREPPSNWVLEKKVDLTTSSEVTFEVPRRGRVLVLPASFATVLVDGVGRVRCDNLGEHFCQTPPVPPGAVTIYPSSREHFRFDVPAGEGRLLVPFPKESP